MYVSYKHPKDRSELWFFLSVCACTTIFLAKHLRVAHFTVSNDQHHNITFIQFIHGLILWHLPTLRQKYNLTPDMELLKWLQNTFAKFKYSGVQLQVGILESIFFDSMFHSCFCQRLGKSIIKKLSTFSRFYDGFPQYPWD